MEKLKSGNSLEVMPDLTCDLFCSTINQLLAQSVSRVIPAVYLITHNSQATIKKLNKKRFIVISLNSRESTPFFYAFIPLLYWENYSLFFRTLSDIG